MESTKTADCGVFGGLLHATRSETGSGKETAFPGSGRRSWTDCTRLLIWLLLAQANMDRKRRHHRLHGAHLPWLLTLLRLSTCLAQRPRWPATGPWRCRPRLELSVLPATLASETISKRKRTTRNLTPTARLTGQTAAWLATHNMTLASFKTQLPICRSSTTALISYTLLTSDRSSKGLTLLICHHVRTTCTCPLRTTCRRLRVCQVICRLRPSRQAKR